MIITISTQVMTLIILTITAPTMIPLLIIFITLIEHITILDAHHETLNIMKILFVVRLPSNIPERKHIHV